MTQRDRDRLVALKKAKKGVITQRQAAKEIGQSERHVRRLLKELKIRGDKAIMHALRGRRSNRKVDEKVRQTALEILGRKVYAGFGPTLAAEYLGKKHGIHVGRETVRTWMIEGKLWQARSQRVEKIHAWRERRSRVGERKPEKLLTLFGVEASWDVVPLRPHLQTEELPMRIPYSLSAGIAILIMALGVPSVASAGPVAYIINFASGPGSQLGAGGSFDYDSSQPVGSQFSNFFVNSDSLTFNLTSSANSATPNGDCSAPVIEFLITGTDCTTHECCALFNISYPAWDIDVEAFDPGAGFSMGDVDATGTNGIGFGAGAYFPQGVTYAGFGYGTWTSTPVVSTVPEPSSLAMVLGGGGGLLFLRRSLTAKTTRPKTSSI